MLYEPCVRPLTGAIWLMKGHRILRPVLSKLEDHGITEDTPLILLRLMYDEDDPAPAA